MVRGEIDHRPAAFRPDKIRFQLTAATDARRHGGIGPRLLPPVKNTALGNGVEKNIVVDRRKTAVESKHRLDVRVIVGSFALQVGREEPELFGDKFLKWITESILWPEFLPAQTLPRLVPLEDLHRETQRWRIGIDDVIDASSRSVNRVNLHHGVHDEIERHDVEGRVLVARDAEVVVQSPGAGIDVLLFTEPGVGHCWRCRRDD